jgi:3-oxoacyl-[acyl-carrier-protein] synthase II
LIQKTFLLILLPRSEKVNFLIFQRISFPKGTGPGEFDSSKLTEGIKSSVSTFIEYALAVSQEALQDANYKPSTQEEQERTVHHHKSFQITPKGVTFGSGIGSIEEIEATHDLLINQGVRKVSPYFIPKILINLAAGHISIKHGLKVTKTDNVRYL